MFTIIMKSYDIFEKKKRTVGRIKIICCSVGIIKSIVSYHFRLLNKPFGKIIRNNTFLIYRILQILSFQLVFEGNIYDKYIFIWRQHTIVTIFLQKYLNKSWICCSWEWTEHFLMFIWHITTLHDTSLLSGAIFSTFVYC